MPLENGNIAVRSRLVDCVQLIGKRMTQKTKVSRGFSKSDWLEAALEMMGEGSLADLTIEKLAKRLKVAKSGFYWHFRSREALIDALLEYWAEDLTRSVTENDELLSMEPYQRLIATAEAILDLDLARHDLAVRHAAEKDNKIAEIALRVTDLRLGFLRQAFSELGFTGDDLEMRTMLFVGYQTWEYTTFQMLTKERRRQLIKRRIDLLTSKA